MDSIKKVKSYEQHLKDIKAISEQIRNSKGKIALKRDSSCCSRSFEYKKGKILIDISMLNQVIEINIEDNFIIVEPLITMEELADATLFYGMIPPVITEFKHMTLGGAIQGLGGESSSFKYGLIDDSVIEYELILGDGSVITINREQNLDLFNALPGSYGSLGVVTKIKLRLINAAKYVRIQYKKVNNIDEVYKVFENSIKQINNLDFIECIAVAKDDFRIAMGYKTNSMSYGDWLFNSCSLKHSFSPWYYCHLLDKSNQSNAYEYIPFKDYLFRWDRGAFWTGLKFKHTLFNRIKYGRHLECKNLYKHFYAKELIQRDKNSMLQDLGVPISSMNEFFYLIDNLTHIYPLWLIPIISPKSAKLFSLPVNIDYAFVDFGIWGPLTNPQGFLEVNRKFEEYLYHHNGRKCFWGQCFCSRDEFWKIYDKRLYNKLRSQYYAEDKFINIYDKVSELYQQIERLPSSQDENVT
ncbi:oxidoreductase [Legionella busanensis]|uniref:Delta(24)-sterol reductase n=1 Tax=Legionella busanensis TaxID=190655 RepID=A0A378JJD3_9GAMM|nr:FAD-binding oxidoreductase [Legionella busanensis]STX50798.1 oxidoreductase [Legionella busanensis]